MYQISTLKPKDMKRLKFINHPLVVTFQFMGTVILFSSLYSCQKTIASKLDNNQKNSIPVEVVETSIEKLSVPIHVSGTISAEKEMRLSFKTGGIIKSIYVDEGGKVNKGKLLAQLDMKEINQQVLQANVALDKAQRDYQRVENLHKDTVATLEQLQNAKSALEVAEATMNIAKYNQKYSSIKAPDKGIILKKFMEENEITGPGTPVFYFASAEDTWKMIVGIADKDIVKLKCGDNAKITTDAWPDKPLNATISRIANAPELYTGLYEVELSISNRGLHLKPGFFARGEIYPDETLTCRKIPVDAVQEGVGKSITYYIYDESTSMAIKAESEVVYLKGGYVFTKLSNSERMKVITSKPKEIKDNDRVIAKQLASVQ